MKEIKKSSIGEMELISSHGFFYRTTCACGDTDCNLVLYLDYDKDFKSVSMNLYSKMLWDATNYNWFENMWRRLKTAFNMIFTGYVEVEGDFLFRDSDHIRGMIEGLQVADQVLTSQGKEDSNT